MASDSTPPNPSDINPPFSAAEPVQASVNEPQTKAEAPKEISPKSVFVNSEPIREEQVQNAVKFLSHPRVRGSPILHRRNFLEKKGLTKEEIDEAFRRVPDPSPDVASGQSSTRQDAQEKPATYTQAPIQVAQPVPAVQPGVMSTMAQRFHWSHAVLAIGFLAISGAGAAIVFKNSVIPRLKNWIRKVVDEDEYEENKSRSPSLAEETTAAAKAAAVAAADVAKASQEMLTTRNEESKRFAEFMSLLNAQLQEIKTMKSAITKLEGQTYIAGRNHVRDNYLDSSITRSMQPVDNKSEYDMRSVRSVSPPASTEPPHPKSYTEIMAMVQRGERPPNVRDIDDRPPNPNQPISNPSLAPRAKPWEVGQPASNSTFTPQSQVTNGGSTYPPQDNGVTYQYNDNSTPWWQQKNPRITKVENGYGQKFGVPSNGMTTNVGPTSRITEVDNGDGQKSGMPSNGTTTYVGPTQRRWVPPQPPPVQMPEAAEAIRQPKSIPKDTYMKAEESLSQSVNEIDELERVTKISESGGQVEINNGEGGSSEIKISEIQEVTEV